MSAINALLTRLPVSGTAAALLGPARLLREGTVVVARTARSWEITLAALAGQELDPGHGSPLDTPTATAVREATTSGTAPAGSEQPPARETAESTEPPVEGWAELSAGAASSAVSDLPARDLEALLAYERAHGRRMQLVQMLEQRLATLGGARHTG